MSSSVFLFWMTISRLAALCVFLFWLGFVNTNCERLRKMTFIFATFMLISSLISAWVGALILRGSL